MTKLLTVILLLSSLGVFANAEFDNRNDVIIEIEERQKLQSMFDSAKIALNEAGLTDYKFLVKDNNNEERRARDIFARDMKDTICRVNMNLLSGPRDTALVEIRCISKENKIVFDESVDITSREAAFSDYLYN